MHHLCTYICVCTGTHEHARSPVRLGVGLGLELVWPPGSPEACQVSPRWRPEGRSSGFLEAECGEA